MSLSATATATCDAHYFGAGNVGFTRSINGKAANELEREQYAENSANFQTSHSHHKWNIIKMGSIKWQQMYILSWGNWVYSSPAYKM